MPKSICLIVAMAALCGCGRRAEPVTRPRQDLDILTDKVDAPEWVVDGSRAGRNRIIVRVPTGGRAMETADIRPDECRADSKIIDVLVAEKVPIYSATVVSNPYQAYMTQPVQIKKIVTIGGFTLWYAYEEPKPKKRPVRAVPEQIRSLPKE